jgi:hypothetical protein
MANHNVFLCFLVCDIHDIKACSPAFSFCFHETSIAVSEIKKRRGGSNVFYYRFGFQTFSFHVHMTDSLLLKMMVMLCLGFELIDQFCFDEIWLWMTFFLGSSCFVLHALSKFLRNICVGLSF